MKQSLFLLSALAAFCINGASSAQTTFNEDVSINGGGSEDQLCVGDDCDNDETYESNKVKIRIKDENTALEFFDVNGQNWMIEANQGTSSLKIGRDTAGPRPFVIDSSAPENSLFVDSNSGAGSPEIGIGTALPDATLHLVTLANPTIKLEGAGSETALDWFLTATPGAFLVSNRLRGTGVLVLENDAPTPSIKVASNGYVGINTGSPDAPLEVNSINAFSFFRITAKDDFNVNQSVDITYTGGPLGTGQLRYNIVDGDNQEMSLDANGNMVLDGTLTTAGPTCAGGCDRVFDADYPLPSITEYSQQMYAAGHLPQVGPTLPGQPFNMTEKMANMLNALEHAHIYIDQLHTDLEQAHDHRQDLSHQVSEQSRLLALYQSELARVTARLDALDAR